MSDRTFEEFFFDFMEETLGEQIGVVLQPGMVSMTISDHVQISDFVSEANFIISCTFDSKKIAGRKFYSVAKAVRRLPIEKPLVLRQELTAQDVDESGGPRKFIYTGVWAIRYHDEESY